MVTTGAHVPGASVDDREAGDGATRTDVAVTVAGVKLAAGPYASSMVTTGAVYPVPPSTTVTVATGPFGSGLNAQLP